MNRSVPKETLKMERDYMRPDKLQITCTKTDGVVLVLEFGILSSILKILFLVINHKRDVRTSKDMLEI